MRRARWAALAATAPLLLTACTATATPANPSSPSVHRSASPVDPPTTAASGTGGAAVGALFTQGLGHAHDCTGTVVRSPSGDVVMTAAHCVSGAASGAVFVPGYDDGAMPFGTWTVTGAHAPSGWLSDADTDDDVAFLTVASHGSTTLQQVTGGVALGTAPRDGEAVTITAYDLGSDDQPVRCTTRVRDTAAQPTIYCGGFAGGSSGSAWVAERDGTPTAVGIIGGRHQGGCVDWTSYSPPFTTTETALLARVGVGDLASDRLPTPPDDGC